MSIYDKPMTIEELTMEATQYLENAIPQIAEHLCEATGLDPKDCKIGRFICNSLCDDNLDATARWLKESLEEADVLEEGIQLDQIEMAFRSALRTRVPGHLLGDFSSRTRAGSLWKHKLELKTG